MKPVESYSAINTRLDRPVLQESVANKPDSGAAKAKDASVINTTASLLATEKAPFDDQKVSEVREKIVAGDYRVDTDALAKKMLETGVFGVETKK
ncbi:flagellar biosynthesis anti-sigma factor FlgM [Parasphingorhabdus cellanae]|uniref:Flagellar biosynthesis anti-sigma factor FlgM n=1 Tax=Parasphingorhabdus cellanae TaxID=2806553 RepID=A0ABX7T3Q0_9SPHN|nr:flagellar biosynthesis anti-sigma factor FlgM [Parasphingorhabdus cellanae]QTD55445.1 flagellar biosynthesis anti-sigma factor FlgM [Parasphingorhabdus cellanae]